MEDGVRPVPQPQSESGNTIAVPLPYCHVLQLNALLITGQLHTAESPTQRPHTMLSVHNAGYTEPTAQETETGQADH